MSKLLEPPSFISEIKSYETYEKDLKRWALLTSVDVKKQALMVVHYLDGDPSGIKDKIDAELEDEKLQCNEGINNLLEFFKKIYQKDSLADGFNKYISFGKLRRSPNTSIQEFIPEWNSAYKKAVNVGCSLSDKVLAFMLLDAANLSNIEKNLVLTGVKYEEANLLDQMEKALRKFVGRSVLSGEVERVEDSTFLTADNVEKVLFNKGWVKKKEKKKREAGDPPGAHTRKKNWTGKDGKVAKCFKCRCEHEEDCDCPCTFHLASQCNNKKEKADLGFFIQTNGPTLSMNQEGGYDEDIALFSLTFDRNEETSAEIFQVSEWEGGGTMNEMEGIDIFTSISQSEGSYVSPFPVQPEGSYVSPSPVQPEGNYASCEDDEELTLLVENCLEDLCLAVGEARNIALIDSACPTTVAGIEWIRSFAYCLPDYQRKQLNIEKSSRVYKFGGGEKRHSKGVVLLPCKLDNSLNVLVRTEIIEAGLPLLIGNTTLKKGLAVLNFGRNTLELGGKKLNLTQTQSGHYSMNVEVSTSSERLKTDEVICLAVAETEELTEKEIQKLHHYWGHCRVDKLSKLIQDAGRLTKPVMACLEKLKESCESCRVFKNRVPRQVVSIPRATRRNQIVTVDLKEWRDGRYILYIIDMFTRFTFGDFIKDKKSVTVAECLLKKWISVFGKMDTLHSDRGGEFNSEELTRIAEYLDVKQTFTAAHSPNQNGTNERNHSIVDRMIEKMQFEDKELKDEDALCWALAAKNSLENYQGFSPAQLTFGENTMLPALHSAGPPGMEEIQVSKALARHINALHLAREAFIQCEADRVLKTALKKRVYARGENISPGDWIYFKNKSKRWNGPVKVTTKDGKLLYVVRAGRLLTINSDHAVLAKSEEKIVIGQINSNVSDEERESRVDQIKPTKLKLAHDELDDEVAVSKPEEEEPVADTEEGSYVSPGPLQGGYVSPDPLQDGYVSPDPLQGGYVSPDPLQGGYVSPGRLQLVDREVHVAGEETPILVPDDARAGSNRNKVSHKDLKKNMTIEYIDHGNRKTGYIVSRAGKVGSKKGKGKEGKYEHYWNVQDIESGHISVVDTKQLEEISRVDEDQEAVTEVEEVYAVNIPWNRHGEQKCRKAKEVELERFDEFDAYEEVEYKGQETLSTSWVLVEKVKAGETIVKARLVVRGDQEDTSDVQTDSPTFCKGNINFVLMISARNGWVVKSQDITAAFLQSVPIERDVFVRPPPERRVPGVIWKLKKTVYGLVDASRGFT